MHSFFRLVWLGCLAALAATAQSPTAEWIWSENPVRAEAATRWFRKSFRTPPYTWNARLSVSADVSAEVFLNGKPVATCERWDQPVRAEVSMKLNQGDNVIAVRARGGSSRAGLLVHLNLGGNETRQVVSDETWRVSDTEVPGWNSLAFDASSWPTAVSLGSHGVEPWGEVLFRASATPASALKLLPGFAAELLRSAGRDEGSWVCMTFDDRGRIYVSPEGDAKPLLRFTLDGVGQVALVETVAAPLRFAMGLLYAHGSLYANAKGPSGSGLYRVTDTDGDDQFEAGELRFLKEFKGGGEHGYHGLALGPDGKIYVLNGNGTKVPNGLSSRSPYRHAGEDTLSLNPDETTRAGGALAPGCQVLRTDPDGREWELVAAGMRNAYDFDFNPDGELFAFDSDNEWDWGMPWYRFTRVHHCISGAEMGWRDGTRAWPDSYPDQIAGVADIGIGSPCGVKFGTRARFPEKYRRALYLQDWSYGRIVALHLQPQGATYRGTVEEFLRGQPLNHTSMSFGPDGALYFITGGRATQSGLYRVTYLGAGLGSDLDGSRAQPLPSTASDSASALARDRRRALEAFHGGGAPGVVDAAWPALGDPDRALRYAARIALEAQPVDRWRARALAETNVVAAFHALLALSRVGEREDQPGLLQALGRFSPGTLDEELRLLELRIIELSFLRQGRPSRDDLRMMIDRLSPRYPAGTWAENRELCRLLVWLEAPGVISRTLDLVEKAPSQEQQIHYVAQLRSLRDGWTADERRRYFAWWLQPRDHLQRPASLLHAFHDVGRDPVDGASFDKHLDAFRRDAIATLSRGDRVGLADLIDAPISGAQLIAAEPRAFVREWQMSDLVPLLEQASAGRDFTRGRRAFIDAQCYVCHRFGSAGGASGPELTGVASKYGRRELLESLLEPSKVISEQFQNVRVFLNDGDEVTGRLVRESDTEMVIETDPLTRTEQFVPRSQVDRVQPSTVSSMPEGLMQVLTQDEILDLLAFLESGGKPDAAVFRPPPGRPQP